MMATDAANVASTPVYGEGNPEADNTTTHNPSTTVEGDPIPVYGEGNPEADHTTTQHPSPTVEGDPIPVYGEGNPEADHNTTTSNTHHEDGHEVLRLTGGGGESSEE